MPQRRRGFTGEHERAIAKKNRRERKRNSDENKKQSAEIDSLKTRLKTQAANKAAASQTQAAAKPKEKANDDMVIKQRPAKRSEAKEKAQAYKGSSFKQKYGNQSNGEQDGAVGSGDFMRNQSSGSNKHANDGQTPDSFQSKQRGMDMSKYQFNAAK